MKIRIDLLKKQVRHVSTEKGRHPITGIYITKKETHATNGHIGSVVDYSKINDTKIKNPFIWNILQVKDILKIAKIDKDYEYTNYIHINNENISFYTRSGLVKMETSKHERCDYPDLHKVIPKKSEKKAIKDISLNVHLITEIIGNKYNIIDIEFYGTKRIVKATAEHEECKIVTVVMAIRK